MLDPKWLLTLAAVIESGGFDKAGKRLHLTQSAISQRIRQLEEYVGQPVLIRSTPVQASATGHKLMQHQHRLALLETELMGALCPQQTRQAFTRLAVGVNHDSLASWFLPAMAPFIQQNHVLLDVVMDDQEYTHDLMRDGQVMGCISTRPQAIQGSESRPLGIMRYLCMATPDFAARYFPDGFRQESVAMAPAILFSNKDDLHPRFLHQLFGESIAFPYFTLPSPQAFTELTLSGCAYSLLPECMLDEVTRARLVDLCPGHFIELTLYWHQWRVSSTLAQRLAQEMTDYARLHLRQNSDAG